MAGCKLTDFFDRDRGFVHMVGICGVGMSGVAYLLKARGFDVSGCDAVLNERADWLREQGIDVQAPHGVEHLDGAEAVVRTAAAGDDLPEIAAATERGLPLFRRGEVLPLTLGWFDCSVAVAGTHGKTTTSSFIAQILLAAGREPWWCIGGSVAAKGGELGVAGGNGALDCVVVEADESDGTLALYHPDVAVITNIEFDHMEHFESVDEFVGVFRQFAGQTQRRIWYCGDDDLAVKVCSGYDLAYSYGFGKGVCLRGELDGSGGMLLFMRGELQGRLDLPAAGAHNGLNLLGAVGVCLELGLDFGEIAAAVGSLGLPRRRFELVSERGGSRVISDYAHHPTEVRALVGMARDVMERDGMRGRLMAVFQPHRYTRTLALGGDFPDAFDGVDLLVLAPVYAASENPLPGGRVCDLYARFVEHEGWHGRVLLAESLEQVAGFFGRELAKGDMLLLVGAGDVERTMNDERRTMNDE